MKINKESITTIQLDGITSLIPYPFKQTYRAGWNSKQGIASKSTNNRYEHLMLQNHLMFGTSNVVSSKLPE